MIITGHLCFSIIPKARFFPLPFGKHRVLDKPEPCNQVCAEWKLSRQIPWESDDGWVSIYLSPEARFLE